MSSIDAVLIDDDPLVRMSWKMVAQQKSKSLLVFSSIDEFREKMKLLDFSTPIYVDSNLGGGIRGEEFALELAQSGFTQIFLATGYRSGDFGQLPGIKGIVGKDPQF
jgi:hypothetical protein